MFLRMIRGAFTRQWKKMLMIALTIALGASLATAMLNVMMDVGDKVNQELKAYGANITVVPKAASVIENLYEMEGESTGEGAYLLEEELGKIKTIFWAFNIVDYAPFIDTTVQLNSGAEAVMVGTWFNHHMELPTGETLDTGVQNLRTWWDVLQGDWLNEQQSQNADGCMVGEVLAARENLQAGDRITVSTRYGQRTLTVVGVYDSGGDEDEQIFAPLALVQELSGTQGYVTSIEVSALTTPDNELAIKAQTQGPGALSVSDYETWYCTAYVSSICYQIQEVITDSVASPVRHYGEDRAAHGAHHHPESGWRGPGHHQPGHGQRDGTLQRNRTLEGHRRHGRAHFCPGPQRDHAHRCGWRGDRLFCWLRLCPDHRSYGVRLGH